MPGVGLWIGRPQGVEYLSSGVSDVEKGTHPGRDFSYRIASVSKAFSGAVALILVRDGQLGLDQTVGDLLGGLVPHGKDVTLRQLLNHTSGLVNYTENQDFQAAFGADPFRKFTALELLAFVADDPLNFPPGSAYRYSNTDNLLIGLIVEAVTHQPYPTVLEARVLKPLGLQSTIYPDGPELPDPFVHGYVPEGAAVEDVSEAFDTSVLGVAGAMISKPGDLARFFSAILRGEVYGRDLLAQAMLTVPGDSDYPGPGVNGAGLALFRYRLPCGEVWGHTGNMPGYRVYAVSSIDGSRTVVMWANLNVPSQQLQDLTLHAQELATCGALGR